MKQLFFLVVGIVVGAGAIYYYGGQIRAVLPITLPAQTESVAGVAYATTDWKVLQAGMVSGANSDQYWGYKISYPRDFESRPDETHMTGLLNNAGWKMMFPTDAFADKKTNFNEAWMTVDFDTNKTGEQCADVSADPNAKALPDETINNATYRVYQTSDAAAGNLYNTKIYRAMVNSVCVEVAQTVHTGNIGNYDPGTVSEFDTKQTDAIFAEMFKGLTFTQVQP